MATLQNKREASSDASESEEVCKRLKEDRKDALPITATTESTEKVADKVVTDELKHSNNNNNNNNDSNNKNSTASEDDSKNVATAETTSTTTDNNSTQQRNGDVSGDNKNDINGDKTTTDSAKVTPEAANKATSVGDDAVKSSSNKCSSDETKSAPATAAATTKTKEEEEKPKNEANSATKTETKSATPEPEEEPTGTLLMCGGANWDMTGRKELPKTAKKPVDTNPAARNLWGPHKVVLEGLKDPLRVKGVFSGCNAFHSVIVTDQGVTMTFGRNERGQLGLGDTETRITPCVVEALNGIDIVAAACGRSHTLFLSSDGMVFACGDNKMGQCGTNQMAVQQILVPARIAFKEDKPVVRVACGAEFSMIIDIDGYLYSFGHPEHGQLGHNSEGKYFTTGNKYAFHCEYQPRRIVTYIEKSREGHVSPVTDVKIVDVACGANHTLAVDSKHRCFSWGFAGYHRLGHSETKNELVPRSIRVFDAPPNSGRGAARVFAGASHSLALDCNGLLYFWGQNKSSGEATMYPKNVQDLCGWRIRVVSSANRSIFVVADDTCISWGPSPTYGELGYGEVKSKSSTVPQEVKTLEGVHVINVACGFGHTLLMARDSSNDDKAALDKFKNWP